MKFVIKDISEISDSKELYEAKPHSFLTVFIYMLLIAVIGALIWMYYGEIDVVSKGRGTIRPNENMSIIRNKMAGVVTSRSFEEGKKVKVGDILFTIDYADLEIKKMQLKEFLDEQEKTLSDLKTLRKSVEQGKNLISPSSSKEYYEKYVKYEQDYKALQKEVTIDTKDESIKEDQTHLSKAHYSGQIADYTKKLQALNEYKQSTQLGKSVFKDETCIEALNFNTYLFSEQELNKEIEESRTTYELNGELAKENLISEQELQNSKVKLELIQNKLASLKISTLEDIEKQIESIKELKEKAENENEQLIVDASLIGQRSEKRKLSIKQYKTNMLVSLNSEIQELEVAYQSKKRELEVVNLSIENCTVVSPIEGIVNIVEDINTGDLLSEGTQVCRIIPRNDGFYKVEIFIPNSGIAGLKKDQKVEFQFDALPYKEYGKLKGHIVNISTDANVMETEGISGYNITANLVNKEVYSYKGEKVDLKVGMTCNAYVIVEQKKILYYLLEKINLKE